MIILKHDPENPHGLTSKGANITQDIRIGNNWYPERSADISDPENIKPVCIMKLVAWIESVYEVTGELLNQITIDQFPAGKIRVAVEVGEEVTGKVPDLLNNYVFEFTKDYIAGNYGIDPSLMTYADFKV